MIVRPPYVVVISSPSAGVGKSTLASNLAVYLKGLAEDLPVAYVSFDSAAGVDAMFALPGSAAGDLSNLQPGTALPELLALGEFAVEFCYAGSQREVRPAAWLRKNLAQADYDGILILDVGPAHPLLTAAIWAADLVLVPIKDPATLGEVVGLRKQFLAGGGCAEQFCLLPSELGEEGRYQCQADRAEFLRFAAAERGFQVLDETLIADAQVREQAAERAKPVLTRVPQSRLHAQLRQLAELILSRRRQQAGYAARLARWQSDGVLPARARRVELCVGRGCSLPRCNTLNRTRQDGGCCCTGPVSPACSREPGPALFTALQKHC
ncbi:MAG: ParA family protein [Deltaproteobacteria bacterium]|nr:ParA family protein [Deltaproteobacteria bacterium]